MIDLIERIAEDNKVLYLSFDKNDKIHNQNVENLYLSNFFFKISCIQIYKNQIFFTNHDRFRKFVSKKK